MRNSGRLQERNRKIGQSKIGKLRPQYLKDHLRSFWKGKCVGDKNPNWKGGRTDLTPLIVESLEGETWKRQALENSPCCEICGSKYCLQVHHLDSLSYLIEKYNITKENWRQFSGVLFDLDNAVVLCYHHHNKNNGYSFHAVFGRKKTRREQFLLYFAECCHILETW